MVDLVFATSDDLGFLEGLRTHTGVKLSVIQNHIFRAVILGQMKIFANI